MGRFNVMSQKVKQDFKKKKIKVGKTISRVNETKPVLKVKSLVLKEQLADKPGYLTKRNRNLKDVISALASPNTGIIFGALSDLREIIDDNPSLLHDSFAILLKKILPLLMNRDSAVRNSLLRLLPHFFTSTKDGSHFPLLPYRNLLRDYFRSAITHVNVGVRFDSLRYLDALLNLSALISPLEAFADMLQHCRQGSSFGLSILDLCLVNKKHRQEILQLFVRILKAIQHKPAEDKLSVIPKKYPLHFVDDEKLPKFKILSKHSSSDKLSIAAISPQVFQLLKGLWREIDDDSGFFGRQALEQLYLITDLIESFIFAVSTVEPDAFNDVLKDFIDFLPSLIQHFPFSQALMSQCSKSKTPRPSLINLKLCTIVFLCALHTPEMEYEDFFCYLIEISKSEGISTEDIMEIVKATEYVLELCSNADAIALLLHALLCCAKSTHALSTARKVLLALISNGFDRFPCLCNVALYSDFFNEILNTVGILVSEGSSLAADVLSSFRSHFNKRNPGSDRFAELLNSSVTKLLLATKDPRACQILIDCLHFVPSLSDHHFRDLIGFIRSCEIQNFELINRLFTVLNAKALENCKNAHFLTSYASFLLTLYFGYFEAELSSSANTANTSPWPFIVVNQYDIENVVMHTKICEAITSFYLLFELSSVLEEAAIKVLGKYSSIPLLAAVGMSYMSKFFSLPLKEQLLRFFLLLILWCGENTTCSAKLTEVLQKTFNKHLVLQLLDVKLLAGDPPQVRNPESFFNAAIHILRIFPAAYFTSERQSLKSLLKLGRQASNGCKTKPLWLANFELELDKLF